MKGTGQKNQNGTGHLQMHDAGELLTCAIQQINEQYCNIIMQHLQTSHTNLIQVKRNIKINAGCGSVLCNVSENP